jgi:hypothetical protein
VEGGPAALGRMHEAPASDFMSRAPGSAASGPIFAGSGPDAPGGVSPVDRAVQARAVLLRTGACSRMGTRARCPVVLMLGQARGIPHHLVVAICKDRLINSDSISAK